MPSWASSVGEPTPSTWPCTNVRSWPYPPSVDLADAAAIPEVWITAFDAMVVQAGLTSGRTALVHAGASGVGTAAIQIAKAMGAFVVVTASAPKLDACRALGADLAIDYRNDDFVEAAMAFTGRARCRCRPRCHRRRLPGAQPRAVAEKGTIIQVGVMGGGATAIDLGVVLRRRVRLIGTVLRSRPIEEKIAITQRFAAEVLPLFDAGLARPVIDSRFELDDIAAGPSAHGGQRQRGQDPDRRGSLTHRSGQFRDNPATGAPPAGLACTTFAHWAHRCPEPKWVESGRT